MTATYKFWIDDRENGLWELLESESSLFIRSRLATGDVIVEKDDKPVLWIERKDIDDFWSSLKDGRYAWQKNNSREWREKYPHCRILWLIEGDWDKVSPDTQKRLRAAMWKLVLRDQSWVWYSRSLRETADQLIYLVKSTQKDPENWDYIWDLENQVPMPLPEQGGGRSVAALSGQRKIGDAGEAWTRMLLLIPGMNEEMVDKFRGRWESLRDWVRECEEGDLWEIVGEIEDWENGKRRWGPAIARRLVEYFGFELGEKPKKAGGRKKKESL